MLYSRYIFMLLLSCLPLVGHASPDMVDEHAQISGLETIKSRVMDVSEIPVYIPNDFSHTSRRYAAYLHKAEKQHYEISIDQTHDCRGAHYCQIGLLKAEVGGQPTVHYDMENKEMTSPVMLDNQIKAYYTQGYALGSFNPASLVWRCRHVLYSISWNEPKIDTQSALINMANAALQGAKCQTVMTPAN